MARITIEDCIKEIPNRFELVILAAERVRRIQSGENVTVIPAASSSVTALKEIAAETLNIGSLRESFILRQQMNFDSDMETEIKDFGLVELNVENQGVYDATYDSGDVGINSSDNLLSDKE